MLVLSSLHGLLSQALSLPHVHTAVLMTPTGELVSAASDPHRSKDEIRVVVGLAMEIWQEVRENNSNMVDGEFGRILVVPVGEHVASSEETVEDDDEREPIMLLALNATAEVDLGILQNKGEGVAYQLMQPLTRYRDFLNSSRMSLPAVTTPVR